MKRIPRSRPARVAVIGSPLVGVALVGVLAGCASTTSAAGAEQYKDGTYTTSQSYQSPGGTEEVAVSVTVKDDLVSAVSVSTVTAEGEGAEYQSRFESAISGTVTGKSLSGLSVSTVAGSSLTSQAFNKALDTIRADAA